MTWDVIVVGGGCAGLAAGTRLAEEGSKVLVLEKRPLLGGRASSFKDTPSGEILDNGQHLFLGCYEETRNYLRRIGTDHLLPFTGSFATRMFGPEGQQATLKTSNLPSPFHLATALLKYSALSLRDRWAMLRVTQDAQHPKRDLRNISVSKWLTDLGQSATARERFWDLITLATLNIHPDRAPAELLAVVLREGFLKSAKASAVGLATVGLSDLHGEPSKKFIERRGGEVRMKSAVKQIVFEKGRVTGVALADGAFERCEAIICAVPPPALRSLAESCPIELQRFCAPSEAMASSAIVSLHVWLERQPFTEPFIGMWGTQFHWVFRKSAIYKDASTQHVTLVTSAAEAMLALSKEQLIALAEKELGFVAKRPIKIVRAVVSRETAATWIPPLGTNAARLPTRSPIPNFFLAGDWTDLALPATIEGAVKSGHQAAEACGSATFSRLKSSTLSVPSVA